ncbi:MAG: hypothetical protein FIB07_11110 [Candidatus Methanoperedens sp.]|nr:hypothetical protein [Candidatus Methanoperedens sp.]
MTNDYKLYGLNSNPFREISAESIGNVSLLHVSQKIDSELASIVGEVSGGGKAVVAYAGDLGIGKTERLRWLDDVAAKSGVFHITLSVDQDFTANMNRLFGSGLKQINDKMGFMWRMRMPGYVKEIKKSLKYSKTPTEYGILASTMLTEQMPSYILLDNIDCADNNFTEFLVSLVNNIKAGSLLCFTCNKEALEGIKIANPSFIDRINKIYILDGLADKEAELMAAKRLAVSRSISNMDPIFPFTKEFIYNLNSQVKGNPRALLKYMDDALSKACIAGLPLIAKSVS